MTEGDSDATAVYEDPNRATAERVDDLLERMTVAEKAGQLVGSWGGQFIDHHDADDVADLVREHDVGALATFGWGGSLTTEPREVAELVNDLQETAREETRLGIPLFFNVDAVHGHAYVAGATVFPNGLGAAATWDTDAVEAAAAVTATEVRASGAHQNYSPTCDVGREIRWGRVFETFGESPFLAAEMARAKVRGYQGDGIHHEDNVVATAKHFPAYSEPERGEDASPVDVSEYKLRNTFVPPIEAAIDEGARSVMPCYNAIDGEAVHGSRRWLDGLLRGDLGFDGTVVSDWGGIRHLHDDHDVAADWRESVHQSRRAGIDVASVGSLGHRDRLVDLVESGDLPESVLDESVRRVLTLKFEMGLFEDPYVDVDAAVETIGSDDHQQVALEAARESMTLLKNEDLLPLDGDEDVFVGGPNADDLVSQVGGWSVEKEEHVDGISILDGVREAVDGEVTHEQGATLTDRLDLDAAVEKAADADVAVLALGEGWYLHEFGAGEPRTETGEFPTRSQVRLPDAQRALLEAVHETGTPVVGVLVTGRPLVVDWMDEHVPSILLAYFPGSMGGRAVAETLVGENDPSGRLPISIPASPGDIPQVHDYLEHPRPIGEAEHPDSYDPLYEFGHGESYTDFEYRDLSVSATDVGPGDVVDVEVTVANVGDRAGTETVQVFNSFETSSLVPPNRRLRGFDRVGLDPGEAATVSIAIPVEDLGLYAPRQGHRVEQGTQYLHVGDHTATLEIDGEYL